ncbi:MAG: hypothetical protein K0S27_869 [Gammaproteobacteria bacterium]|jgi:hypothetical protein|nr:hypothetical protein [Gammaproteobacteria bacterium]
MTQPRPNEDSVQKLEKELELLNTLAIAIKNSTSNIKGTSNTNMNARLSELADGITTFIAEVRAHPNPHLNLQNIAIASAISTAIMTPTDDNRKILRETAKNTYYEALSFRIEELIAKTKLVLQPAMLRFFVGFTMGLTATAVAGPVGAIIAIAAGIYMDSQVLKNTPEQLQKKEADAKNTSAALYKAHGLLSKAKNIKIDTETQAEINSRVSPQKPSS